METSAIHPVAYILGYVVKLLEPANKSRRSPVDQPQLRHPNPQETNKNGTAAALKVK